jgi:hypothetical protein
MKNPFKKKKKYVQLTIEEVEQKSGVKLTYPNQNVEGSMDEERYKELKGFGCSDIWDEKGSWMHRDCFSRKCDGCNFYPILEKYNEENGIDPNMPADLGKAFEFLK